MLMIRLLILMLLVAFVPASLANVQNVELRLFSQPTLLAGNGRYKQAAEQYHRLSIQILASESKLGTDKMWQYAGLAEALATVCANLDNDAKAYEYWANSVRYLLTGGTDWSQMRQHLHQRNEQANTQLLTQMQTFDVAGGYDQSWENDAAVLQVWQEKLSLFTFNGPRTGMRASAPSVNTIPEPVVPVAVPSVGAGVPGQKKLKGIESNFSQAPSFAPVPESATPKANEKVSEPASQTTPNVPKTNRHLIQAQSESTATGGVVATPIEEFDYESMERDSVTEFLESSDTSAPSETQIERSVPRANIDAESTSGVEAIQRRSFAPVPAQED
ncbi:hypothetical protein J4N45_09170 [Vibrio sp. SCSIO 43140]|uniref:hypothetical protein n=1 Tax=Vibrio sp. SCSIO 43140 TaxID=2819100 RepID=UPI002074DFE2|nr:hypothetical protein [Vibrio sp. SCSIO 43140]USD58701.1 hypothetical protein J4N45_09170 [Vibrio sp. SCSIO 43140]